MSKKNKRKNYVNNEPIEIKVPNIKKDETILEYFVKNTEGKGYKEKVQIMSVINAMLLAKFGMFQENEHDEKFFNTCKEVVEFGNYFAENYGDDKALRKHMYRNWGQLPYVLRMYEYCLSELQEEELEKCEELITPEIEKYVSNMVDKEFLNLKEGATVLSSIPHNGYFNNIFMPFDTTDFNEEYDNCVHALNQLFAFTKKNKGILQFNLHNGNNNMKIFCLDYLSGNNLPKSASVSQLEQVLGEPDKGVQYVEYKPTENTLMA